MLSTALFEVDISAGQMVFSQSGFLKDFVTAGQIYEHDILLRRFIEERVFAEDQEKVWESLRIANYLAQDGRIYCEYRLLMMETGEYCWFCTNAMVSQDKKRMIGIIEDIHQQKQQNLLLQFQAEHDFLTGLMNRNAFRAAAQEQMAIPGATGMYALLDIDDFKQINDGLGHSYGDWLLVEVGSALRAMLPEEALIGRYGGDEFMVYLPGVDDIRLARRYAQKMLNGVSRIPVEKCSLSISIGIALYPIHSTDMDTNLEECADLAMYQAKANGKNRFCVYDPLVKKIITDRRRTEGWRQRYKQWLDWMRENQHTLAVLFFCLLFFTVVFSGLAVSYSKSLHQLMENESREYLTEISAQVNRSLLQGIGNNYVYLHSVAAKLEQDEQRTMKDILAELAIEKNIFQYQSIALLDEEGYWVDQYGEIFITELQPYLEQMQETGNFLMTPFISLQGEKNVVFLQPLQNVYIDGRQYFGIGALTDISMLNDMITVNLFDGAGYVYLVNRQGEILVRPTHFGNPFLENNLFDQLEQAVFTEKMSVEKLRDNFRHGKNDDIRYTFAGRDWMSIYTAASYGDWYLFVTVPRNILSQKTADFYGMSMLICGAIFALFFILLLTIFLLVLEGRRKLVKQLYTDLVTGGRSKIKFELDGVAALRNHQHCSMVYANIDKFKLVNERNGSTTGDRLLRGFYRSIEQELEPGELIARLMADHFAILVTTQDTAFLLRRIQHWNERLQEQAVGLNIATPIGLSCGVFPVAEEDRTRIKENDITLLLDKANLARKLAPRGNRMAVYDELLAQQLQFEEELESRQEQALDDGEFVVYFQPKYSPQTNGIVGAEALVRWITTDHGILMPNQYISLFESNGFIAKLDLYVFEQTCQFIARMQQEGLAPIPVSVNLSRYNLSTPEFIHDYVQIWRGYYFSPALVEFEITETLVYENIEQLNSILDDIHKYGFRVAMDDFGNGYSSLNMLKNMDIDVLKLDREFFNQAEADSQRALQIVGRLIELAKDLGMEVVAEGVETNEQVVFLRERQCQMIQGYYYSRPIPEEELWQRLLAEQK